MAAESAAISEPHHDGVKNPAEQLQDVPPVLLAAHANANGRIYTHHIDAKSAPQPVRVTPPTPRNALATACATTTSTITHSETTPLVLRIDTSRHTASSVEEVHPLPWFRSPEWTRRSPLAASSNKSKRTCSHSRMHSNASTRWWCFPRSDVELGHHRRLRTRGAGDDTDGFRQCIQFVVALIVIVAIGLVFLVVFEPFDTTSAAAAVTAGGGGIDGGGW